MGWPIQSKIRFVTKPHSRDGVRTFQLLFGYLGSYLTGHRNNLHEIYAGLIRLDRILMELDVIQLKERKYEKHQEPY